MIISLKISGNINVLSVKWVFYLTQLSWHLQTADKDTGNGRFKYNWLASWVVQGLSYLSAQGALTRPFGQLPGVGDDRLLQTYSQAANPNGLILTSVPVSCVTIKQPPSVTSVMRFSLFQCIYVKGGCRSLKISVKSNRDTTQSQSPFTVVMNRDVFKNKVVLLSLNRLLVHLDL